MFFIKIDKNISIFGLSIIKDLKLCGTIDMMTGQPVIFFEYQNAKFRVQSGTSQCGEIMTDRGMMKGFANGEATDISLYIENNYYKEALSLLDLLKSYQVRAFMVLLDDSKIGLDKK